MSKKRRILSVGEPSINIIPPNVDSAERNPYTTIDYDFTISKVKGDVDVRLEFKIFNSGRSANEMTIFVQDTYVATSTIKKLILVDDVLAKLRGMTITLCNPKDFFKYKPINTLFITSNHGNIFLAGDIDEVAIPNGVVVPWVTIDKKGDADLIPAAMFHYLKKVMAL